MENKEKLNKVQEYLERLDINYAESKVYLTLLSSNGTSITDIAKKAQIARTTVHTNVQKLLEKGLAPRIFKNDQRLIFAESPSKLKTLIKQKQGELESKVEEVNLLDKEFPNVMGYLSNIIPAIDEHSEVVVKYFEGLNGFRDVCNRSLDYADGEICFLSNHNNWRKAYPEDYDKTVYVPERVKRGIKMRSLVLNNEQGQRLQNYDENLLRETRFLPPSFKFDTTLIMYRNEVSIMVSSTPYVAINIKSQAIYDTFRNIFENLWNNNTQTN